MRPEAVRLRQQQLLIRSAELRQSLSGQLYRLEQPAGWVDQVRSGVSWLYRNPQWPVAVAALMLAFKPRRFAVWAGRAWWIWRIRQRLRHLRDTLALAAGRP